MSFVVIDQLYKKYNQVTALNDVNLEIKEGEFFALLGPSGCGKTTTMRCIAGFEEPSSGSILINGENVNNVPVNKRKCGMVFQSYALFPHMTVFENVAYSLQVRRYNEGGIGKKIAVMGHLLNRKLGKVPPLIEKKVHESLEFVELERFADRLTGQLSGGQQQRVALARALIMEPTVLLMDEPLSNLDKKLRNTMRTTIREIQQKVGITTIFVTHDQEEAMSMADRVAVMSEGKVVQIDTPTSLYRHPNSKMVADFVGDSNIFLGTVKEHAQGNTYTTIQIDEHNLLKTTYSTKNTDVEVLVRPEGIRLWTTSPGENSENVFKGTVKLATYLGSAIRYDIQVGSLQFIVDSIFKDGDNLLTEGMNVWLGIDPEQVVLV
jgi:ABC-type Fe3+/spermidine/putrescine transport system ATPase subunit